MINKLNVGLFPGSITVGCYFFLFHLYGGSIVVSPNRVVSPCKVAVFLSAQDLLKQSMITLLNQCVLKQNKTKQPTPKQRKETNPALFGALFTSLVLLHL